MDCCGHAPAGSRRQFLQSIALGGGAALLSTLPATRARAAGHTDALLLSCMDYRLTEKMVDYMDQRGLHDRYDHVILAGASLGVLTDRMPDWGKTFWQHLDIAIELHSIHKVIVLDHRDCGAYRVFLGPAAVETPAAELAVHTDHLTRLGGMIRSKHQQLEVELGIMALDGSVQTIA